MKTRFLWAMLMAFVMMFTLAIAASAQDRDDQNRDRDDQNRAVAQDRDHDRAEWQARKDYEYRTYDRDQRPEGWERGTVTQRTYCENHEPCYTYQYQGSPYYYYNDNGRMWVRRQHRDRDDMNKDRDDRKRDNDDHHDNDQHR